MTVTTTTPTASDDNDMDTAARMLGAVLVRIVGGIVATVVTRRITHRRIPNIVAWHVGSWAATAGVAWCGSRRPR